MSKHLTDMIRGCLCKEGKLKPRAAELSDGQLIEVFNRLRRGENPNEIARYAQKEWGFMTDRTAHTCGQAIRKLAKRIPHLLLGGSPAHTQSPCPVSDTVIPAITYEDIISIQGRLYLEMRRRTARMLEGERATGIRYKDSAKDLKAISSFGILLTKMEEFELKNADQLEKQGGGAEEQEKLSAQYRLVERSLELMERERATDIPRADSAKDFMAILSCAKNLLMDRQFEMKNKDLIKERKRHKDEMVVEAGFARIIADEDKNKDLLRSMERFMELCEENAITMEEAAEEAGMTLEDFKMDLPSYEARTAMGRENMVLAFAKVVEGHADGVETSQGATSS